MFVISERIGGSSSLKTYKIYKKSVEKSSDGWKQISFGKAFKRPAGSVLGIISYMAYFLRQAFLPTGYPESVSQEYAAHRRWELIQEFANMMTVTLATEQVMRAAGVGDALATPVTAATLVLIKNGIGALGGVVVTWRSGGNFYTGNKKWRFIADILCDSSIFLEMISSYFSMPIIFTLTCISSLLRFTCGVIGKSTRLIVHKHHAQQNNFEEVFTRDMIQSQMVGLCSLTCSLYLLQWIDGSVESAWILYVFFTFLHLYSNYKALRVLQFKVLNTEMLLICLKQFLSSGTVPSIQELSQQESILPGYGLNAVQVCGFQMDMGTSFDLVLKGIEQGQLSNLNHMLDAFVDKPFIIVPDTKLKKLQVVLRQGVTPNEIMEAFVRAVIGVHESSEATEPTSFLGTRVTQAWARFSVLLESNGFNLRETQIQAQCTRADWKRI